MAESQIANFIESVASLPGNSEPLALWPSLLTCAFAAANCPSAVPIVYLCAIKPHIDDAPARRLVLQRMKEALLKGTWLFGVPRALNVFYALVKVLKDGDSIDREVVRAGVTNPFDFDERGLKYFENIYRKDMPAILEPMDRLFPDLRVLTVHMEYGLYLSETKILSSIETSMTTIASLLPMDVPQQVRWHMRGLLRNNGSEAQILEALKVAKGAADVAGVVLKHAVPEVGEVMTENLFE